jgi:hypothetical protein
LIDQYILDNVAAEQYKKDNPFPNLNNEIIINKDNDMDSGH